MAKVKEKICQDCGTPSIHHVKTWLDGLTQMFLPPLSLPKNLDSFFYVLLEKFLTFFKLVSLKEDFAKTDIQSRTRCFMEEAEKRGVKFKALQGPFGYTGYFSAEINGKVIRFEGLPIAEFANKQSLQLIDDKEKTKRRLQKGDFPVAEGKSFWFWQKNKAIKFGINRLGFPLIVKPRSGSISQHVTTNIQDIEKLKYAIARAIIYSPVFMVEKFISDGFVCRATVIDFDFIACVKQIPANVIGDEISTIRELIDEKNKKSAFYKIVENETTKNLLAKKGYGLSAIPKKNELVYLQKDPFLKLGGDLVEITPEVHPENLRLFRDIAKFFDIRVVGLDFLCQDIAIPWKNQECAVLELNSLPCIELHHFPSSGIPQNAAGALVDLFFKYYL